jgi:hypothetical protein
MWNSSKVDGIYQNINGPNKSELIPIFAWLGFWGSLNLKCGRGVELFNCLCMCTQRAACEMGSQVNTSQTPLCKNITQLQNWLRRHHWVRWNVLVLISVINLLKVILTLNSYSLPSFLNWNILLLFRARTWAPFSPLSHAISQTFGASGQ